METAAVDFETYYSKEVGIETQGVWHYCRHPEFDAYLVTISTSTGQKYCGRPENFDWSQISGENWRWVSHNRSFDKPVYESLVENGKIRPEFPQVWDCTADLSAFLAVPRNLKGASEALLGAQMSKDTRNKMKGRRWEDMDEAFRREVEEYAIKDADYCLEIWQKYGHEWPEHEQWLSRETTRMCLQGVPINKSAVRDRIEHLKVLLWEAQQKLPWVEEDKKTLSPLALAEECRKVGILPPPSLAEDSEECEAWEKQYGEQYPWVAAMRQFRKCNGMLKKLQTMEKRTRPDGWMSYGLKYYGATTGRDSGDAQANLQNLNRGESYGVNIRSLIEAPEGMSLVVADLAQIEPRCLAWLARDFELLEFIRQCPDLYEAQARAWGFWDKPEPLKTDTTGIRHLVKQCIAEGSLVLTDKGEVPIEQVTLEHKVWDGENYVNHEGLIYQGEKEVIEYDGVVATPDHRVFVDGGQCKIEFQQAARELRPLTRTGAGGAPVRIMGSVEQRVLSEGQLLQVSDVSMHEMQSGKTCELRQSALGEDIELRELCGEKRSSRIYSEENGRGQATMHQPERQELPELRGAGDYLSLEERVGSRDMGGGESGYSADQEIRFGQNRQRQGVLPGKSALDNAVAECAEPAENQDSLGLRIQTRGVAVLSPHDTEISASRVDSGTDLGPSHEDGLDEKSNVESDPTPTRKARVFDILNCGPNHRFTVNGRLVSNCGLGLGYGMGVKRFSETTGFEEHEAKRLVQLYRQKNPKVGELWKKLENNLRMSVIKNEDKFFVELPSGRKLVYREPNNNEGHLSAKVVRGGQFIRLKWWGGSITENLVQAMARDVFMHHVQKIREAGLSVIMRVHDEVVCCVHDDQAEAAKEFITQTMSTPPEWAKSLPLAAEAKITRRYEK